MVEGALIERTRWGDSKSFSMVLRGISRRIATVTERRFSDHGALIVERHGAGGKRLTLRPEMLEAIDAEPSMRRIMMLPVEEILATRNPAEPQKDQSKWPRLA